MQTSLPIQRFSDAYASARRFQECVADDRTHIAEETLQCIWYDQVFSQDALETEEGHRLRILSPGWWNQQEGPDFRGAQIEFNGTLYNGDIEVHRDPGGWRAHGHHLDERYNQVLLHVVLHISELAQPPTTADGRKIPTLSLGRFLQEDILDLVELLQAEPHAKPLANTCGKCAEIANGPDAASMLRLIELAGEWRILNKARRLRRRMERVGEEQALYEAFLSACGYSHFKQHFEAVARHLPWERAQQLALQEPYLLEAALLQIAGLLPKALPEGTTAVPHFARLRGLRNAHLAQLRSLPLEWKRIGVRPNNNPERRLAGAAAFLQRHARQGLVNCLDECWQLDGKPLQRRRAFEALFPKAMGFWATHCTWTGKKLAKPVAMIGSGRVRSILGNVFLPAGLALARQRRDRTMEETVFQSFKALPKEPDNYILKRMTSRILGPTPAMKTTFRTQQGMLQLYQDWCENNPSCQHCSLLQYLGEG